jgi:hypothetical protein
MPLSRSETTSEPFSTTEPTEITERGHWFEYLVKKSGRESKLLYFFKKIYSNSDPHPHFFAKYSNQCSLSVISVGSVVENGSDVVSQRERGI